MMWELRYLMRCTEVLQDNLRGGICEFLCKHFDLTLEPIVLEKGKRAHFTKLFFEDPDLQLLKVSKILSKIIMQMD